MTKDFVVGVSLFCFENVYDKTIVDYLGTRLHCLRVHQRKINKY